MSDLVREYFPDAPERCIECPGLERAATQLKHLYELAVSAAVDETHPGTGTQEPVAGSDFIRDPAVLDAMTTDIVLSEHATVSGLAKNLYEDCADGVGVKNEIVEIKFKWSIVTRFLRGTDQYCTSSSPLAAFIPVAKSFKFVKKSEILD